ncbi:MAG: argininosuccinate synthase domain-containing protein, partial [Candidatus Bathyarchaeia archaeon]
MKNTVILAYSGGLDTSVLIKWLQENQDVDVITFTMELGQQTDLKQVA